jgi:biopolymer transport protein ExbD
MPPKTLVRVGMYILAAGIFLYWAIPIWLRSIEPYKFDWLMASVAAWVCLSLAGAGSFLLIRAVLNGLAERSNSTNKLSIFPTLILRNVMPLPRHRPIPLIAQLPNFGLIFGAVLWILVFLFMIVRGQHRYYGLPVDFKARDSLNWTKSPWQETLSVYLAVGEKYYVNNRPVKRDALRDALQKELSHRMAWVVYFEADYDTLNMNAIYAMDVIQGLGAKLIWLTPKVREEMQQKELSQAGRVTLD